MLVCFASEKGGAGKTTLAALLAERLAGLGVPLRLADGDRQGSLFALSERSDTIPLARKVFPMQFASLANDDEGVTILDLPSGIGVEFHAAMAVAHFAIVPAVPSAFDLRTLPATLSQIRAAQERRDGPPKAIIVPNKLDLRESMSRELLSTLGELGWPVTRCWIQSRATYRRMGAAGLQALPKSSRRAAELEVAALVDEILAFLRVSIPAKTEAA
jgi:chromosome partitioning protein